MNDEADTFLIDHDPAKLLPFEKRLIPEDPETETLGRHFMRDSISDVNDPLFKSTPAANDDL